MSLLVTAGEGATAMVTGNAGEGATQEDQGGSTEQWGGASWTKEARV